MRNEIIIDHDSLEIRNHGWYKKKILSNSGFV